MNILRQNKSYSFWHYIETSLTLHGQPWLFHSRSFNTIQSKERFYISPVASQTSDTFLPDLSWILSLIFTTMPFFARRSDQKTVTAPRRLSLPVWPIGLKMTDYS